LIQDGTLVICDHQQPIVPEAVLHHEADRVSLVS